MFDLSEITNLPSFFRLLLLTGILFAGYKTFANTSITSVKPENPVVGDTVLLFGNGFDLELSKNRVFFNNWLYVAPGGEVLYDTLEARVIAASDTVLTIIVPLGAIGGNISVTVNQKLAASSGVNFQITPVIKQFLPYAGIVGDTIVIVGTGFDWRHPWANFVWFTNGNSTTAISGTPTSIKVIVPMHATSGPVYVSRVKSSVDFTVLPAVERLSYHSGQVGDIITIFGTGFDPSQVDDYQVTFNGQLAEINRVFSQFIEVVVPVGVCSGPVALTFKGQRVAGPSLGFVLNPSSVYVDNYSVKSGFVGAPITIIGQGFDQCDQPVSVSFGGKVATIIRYTADSIYTLVPRGALSGPVSVSVGATTSQAQLFFKVKEKIDSISHVDVKVGDTVTVYGTGFSYLPVDSYEIYSSSILKINGLVVTDSTLKFIIPYNIIPGELFLSTRSGVLIATLPYFNVLPVIHKIEPDTVISGRKQVVRIRGAGFGRGMNSSDYKVIFFQNIEQRKISSKGFFTDESDNGFVEVTTSVPDSAKTGPVLFYIDSVYAISPKNLVILPDTFPYQPSPPEIYLKSVTSNSFTIWWPKQYRTFGYLIDVSNDNFSTFLPGLNSKQLGDTVSFVSNLEAGTIYDVRIRGYSETDTSAYSYPLRIVTIPPKPFAFPPVWISDFEYLLGWNQVKGANGYIVDLSIDRFVSHDSVVSVENQILIRVLDQELRFFEYRVRSFNDFGISDYSNVVNVLVTEVQDLPKEKLSLFPNPASELVFVSGLKSEPVESHLVDSNGRSQKVNLQRVGDYHTLEVHNLNDGLYVLTIASLNFFHNFKFVKVSRSSP